MPDAAVSLDDVLAELRALRREVAAFARPTPRLLSKRAAARMLGVDRGTKLERYIRVGALRLIDGRIPLPDVERLVRDGPPAPPTRRRPVPAKPANDEAGAIRDLDV